MVNEVLDVMTEQPHEGMTMMRNARNGLRQACRRPGHLHGPGAIVEDDSKEVFFANPVFAAGAAVPGQDPSPLNAWSPSPDGR